MTEDDVIKLAWRFCSEKKKLNDPVELVGLSNLYMSIIPPEWFHEFKETVIELQGLDRKDIQ